MVETNPTTPLGSASRPMTDLTEQLRAFIASSPELVRVLRAVREVAPEGAYVAAGAIRDTVWNRLTGRGAQQLEGDVDVVYFDANETAEGAREFERELTMRLPHKRWEVTNQAHVHLWYRDASGGTVAPFQSVPEAVATWPETATAVGARLSVAGHVDVLAPLGLEDLFALVVRHNPARVDSAVFRERLARKRWAERWPELKIVQS
jgi:hypothetical protein